MTPEFLFGFVIGTFVGVFVATVFYAVRWNEEHGRANKAERELKEEREEHDILKVEHTPKEWLDSKDVAVNIAGQQKMYDRHPDLIKPGTEVIRIHDMDDIPSVSGEGRSG